MPNWKKVVTSGSNAHLNHITASGNISASGDVKGLTLTGTLQTAAQGNITSLGTLSTLTVDDITINGSQISDSGNFKLDVGNAWINTTNGILLDPDNDSIECTGHITASNNISASGHLNSNKLLLNNNGSTDYLTGTTDGITYKTINHKFQGHITASGNISGSSTSIINVGGEVQSKGQRIGSFDGTNVRLGDSANPTILYGTSLVTSANITASGNISSSGELQASTVRLKAGVNSYLQQSSNTVTLKSADTSITLIGNVTASQNISSSGTISMLTASIGGGLFTSASLASSGGGGGAVDSIVAGDGIDVSGATGDVTVTAEDASTTNPGVVELATTAETTTGTDTARAVTPDGLKDGYQGSANVVTLGTIGTGTWNGTAIASAYLDSDTAHLTTDQTFSGKKTFSAPITASGDISASANSTGSFGKLSLPQDGKIVIYNAGSIKKGSQLDSIEIDTSNLEVGILKASGDVTVGGANLHIGADNSNQWELFSHNSGLLIRSASATYLNITDEGNVLIGKASTTDSGEKLQVEGDISASGFISTLSHITASGVISASGDILGDNFVSNGESVARYVSVTDTVVFTDNTPKVNIQGTNIQLSAPVTASGDISSSITSTGSFGHLMVGGGNFTSASLASSGGGGGGSDDLSWNNGTTARVSGSAASSGSFGHLKVGNNNFLGNPNTLVGIDESVATAADKIAIWDESDDLWKYITIDNLQDEIDTTGGGGGGGISFDGSTENGVLTYKDSDEATVESKMIFDGGTLFIGEIGSTYVSASTSGELEISGSGTANFNVDGHISANHITASSDIRGNILYQTSSITAVGNAQGDIVKFGNTTTIAGCIYAHTGSGWVLAGSGSANNGSSSLGFAVGTNSTTHGMLLRGMANIGYSPGGLNGCALYLETPGSASYVVPSTSGDISRVVGWNYGSDTIYFNPDNTWIKIT